MSEKKTAQSSRVLVLIGLTLVGLLVVAGIVVAFREPTRFEPGTPEAATQDYLLALLDEDFIAAHGMLTPDLQERCDVDE